MTQRGVSSFEISSSSSATPSSSSSSTFIHRNKQRGSKNTTLSSSSSNSGIGIDLDTAISFTDTESDILDIDKISDRNMLSSGASSGEESRHLLGQTSNTTSAASASSSSLLFAPVDKGGNDDILLSRRIARFLNKRFSWYGRNADIDQAWDYFENITLPRRMIDEDKSKDSKCVYVKAPTGTKDSRLYPAWTTKNADLADFGTGVAVYFETMWALVIMMLVAGLLYTPTFLYYQSDAYGITDQTITFLSGSLICDDTAWVPCPDCTLEEWHESPHRFAFSADSNLPFVLQNNCAPLRWQEGVNHLLVVAFWIGAIVALAKHQQRMERKYDEAKLTASDYSIQVDNPPFDAKDPDEWKTFFSQFGKVSYVTVALHNEDLVDLLVKRRVILQKLSFLINGRSDDVPLQFVPRRLAEEHPKTYKKLMDIETKCRQTMQSGYDVSAVFVTFEKEAVQRKALQALTVGKIHTATNNTRIADKQEYLFRGNRVLDVFESVEPSAIRWQDLDETLMTKILQRIVTYSITVFIIYLGFITVRHGFEQGSTFAAYEIVLLNILVPNILRIVNRFESHPREGTYQASLYIKVCAFRWINTAIITMYAKPLMATIEGTSGGLIPSVYAVLKAEIVTVPILHMIDIMGNIKRHILAPLAANQAAMNSYFGGAPGFLGEKYTGVTKIVFLCFFYSVIFPSSFFFGAAALAIAYWTEKFNLLRSWAPIPELGDQVAWISRNIFFPLAVFALVIMSEFYWSAYPFDDVCDSDTVIGDGMAHAYQGTHTIFNSVDKSKPIQVNVEEGDKIYRYCNQDFKLRLGSLLSFFEEEKDDWMSKDQMILTYTFGIFCAVTLAIMAVYFCHRAIVPQVNEAIGATYTTDEIDSKQNFVDQRQIKAYVPQIRHRSFHYPLLACQISNIVPRHIGWADPIRNHSYYDMSEDVRIIQKGKQDSEGAGPALSIVRHYYSGAELDLLSPSIDDSDNSKNDGYGTVAVVSSRSSKNPSEE